MAYCTLDDIRKALPNGVIEELTDDEDLSTVDEGRVDEAVAKADSEIDTYLGGRYAVPLSSVPDVVRMCSVAIAVYHLYSRKAEEVPETRETRYRNAVRFLKDVRDRKMDLPISEAGASGFAMGTVSTSHFEEDDAA